MAWTGPRSRSPEHKRWARQVLQRDNYQCQQCGYQGAPGAKDVAADHIINVAAGGTDDLDNGQTLCTVCHGIKTQLEAAAGIAKRSRHRPPEQHPGRITR